MKKLMKKLVALVLGALLATSFIGCGEIGGTKNADENTVQFYVWKSGFGVDWLEKIVDNYNKSQSQYKVDMDYTSDMNAVLSSLNLGTADPYDLYLTGLRTWSGTVPIMEDLTDVVDAKYGNESKTIREKINPAELNKFVVDGKVTSLSLGGHVQGILYNYEMFDEYDLDVPKTTDELDTLVWNIQSRTDMTYQMAGRNWRVSPFAHYKDANNGDWKSVYEVWVAQYLGYEGYQDLIQLKDTNGKDQKNVWLGNNPDGTSNKENDARYKVLCALESMLTSRTVHLESNTLSYTDMQTKFINGQAAMMVSGSHLKKEMGVTGKFPFKIMDTPVLSAIVEKLEYRNAGDEFMEDEQLSSLIDAIDQGKTLEQARELTGMTTLSQSDYDRVSEARKMNYGRVGEAGQLVFIPTYSNAKDAAKDFLKYMYSDAGAVEWMKSQKTEFFVELLDESKVDTSNYTEWDNSVNHIIRSRTVALGGGLDSSRIFVNNSKDIFANVNIIMNLTVDNVASKRDADGVWKDMLQIINDNWKNWSVA